MKNNYKTAFVCLLIAIASGCGGQRTDETLKRDWETVFDETGEIQILLTEDSHLYRVSFNPQGNVTWAILPFEGGRYILSHDDEFSKVYETRPGHLTIRDKYSGEILEEKKGTNWIIDVSTSTIVPKTNETTDIDMIPL